MDIPSMLKEMVSINSVYPGEEEFGKYMKNVMESIGMRVRRQRVMKHRYNIIGEIGEGEKEILLLGHLDTVPPAEGWDDPFFLKINGRKAIGLGASDMKGGILAGLESLEGYEGNAKIKFALMVDEENESLGSWKFVNSQYFSGDFCISLETGMGLGPRVITLGRRGRVVIKVEFVSTSRHLIEEKSNAITEMSKFISSLENMRVEIHEELGMGAIEPLKVFSEVKGLSYPEKAVVYIDRHYVPPVNEKSAISELLEFIRSLNIECAYKVSYGERSTPFLKPFTTPPNHPMVQKLKQAVTKRFRKAYFSYAKSVADENRIAEYIPTVAIGPKGGNEHSPGEWVDLKSIEDLAGILREFYSIV